MESSEDQDNPLAAEVGVESRGEPDVSDQDRQGHTHPDHRPLQDPPAPPTTEVVVDDSGVAPAYANFCRVTATPEEVILDFGLNPQPFAAGRQAVKVDHRIVMSAYTTKRLLAAIGMSIQRHEQTFGAVEMDINRRVSPYRPPVAPPGSLGPAGQPGALRLT